jgi:23S rRNA (uracil1939-C5)-methyltransferase
VCGGCECQDVAYVDQLAAKARYIGELFSELHPGKVEPIIGSSQEYPTFFRNKIRFSFIREDGIVTPSRHKRGEESAEIAADHCYLQSEEANQIIRFIAMWADTHTWTLYDPKTEVGWLKHILIRQGKRTGEVMLGLVTDTQPIPDLAEFIEAATSKLPFLTSLYHTESWGKSLEKLTDTLLWGKPYIEEMIGEYRFAISPQAFFQTNSDMVESLYTAIKRHAGTGKNLWDLYAGSATIGLFLSKNFEKVLSIEVNPSNILDAKVNSEFNAITNVEVIEGAVEDVLTSAFLTTRDAADCIVLDPPRAGLHQRLRTLLPHLKAKKIVYVSCNPFTCLRDCRELVRAGMRLTSVQPVDMFPHSWHCEMIAVLEPAQ